MRRTTIRTTRRATSAKSLPPFPKAPTGIRGLDEITGEHGDGMLTRQGLEEYVSDCVIVRDHRVTEQVTSLGRQQAASTERISTGVSRLDATLGGAGFFRGERVLYFAIEESPSQIMRNMRSIGIDLASWVEKGLLQFHASRPAPAGLEMHLATMHKVVEAIAPTPSASWSGWTCCRTADRGTDHAEAHIR